MVRARIGVIVHAAIVAVLAALLIIRMVSFQGVGADTGAGLLILLLSALGLPWTIPFLSDPYSIDTLTDPARFLLVVAPAVLNVALHAVIFQVWRRCRHTHGR